jgi:hypothetical protein
VVRWVAGESTVHSVYRCRQQNWPWVVH